MVSGRQTDRSFLVGTVKGRQTDQSLSAGTVKGRQTDQSLLTPSRTGSVRTQQSVNPFTAPACKISGLNDAGTGQQTVHFPVLLSCNLIYFQCCAVLMKILTHASEKSKTTRLTGFTFLHFYGPFSNDITAVKGLIENKAFHQTAAEC